MVRQQIAVIGAGVAGLVAARELQGQFDVTIFEAASTVGGKLATTSFRDHFVDTGPDAFITRNRAAVDLVSELGLSDRLIAPSVGSAAVYARGALRPFPKGLVLGIPTNAHALSRSGIVSYAASVRTLFDRVMPWRVTPRKFAALSASGDFDPSVAALVGPRLGKQVLSQLVDPLIGGINASDVTALSFAAALPQFVETIAGRRSLMAALRSTKSSHPPMRSGDASPATSAVFNGIDSGISRLIDALSLDLGSRGATVRCSTTVESLQRNRDAAGDTWHIKVQGDKSFIANAVILAVPAFVASSLLGSISPQASALCASIPFSSVATVTSVWRRADVVGHLHELQRGFGAKRLANSDPTQLAGILIPRRSGLLVTAISFTSSKWPSASASDEFVIRCSLGRHGDDRSTQLSDEQLMSAVASDLQQVIGLSVSPLETHVSRWPLAFPQYTVGHLARMASLDEKVADIAGVFLAGASYRGIGIPACIDSAHQAVSAAKRFLSPS